MGRAAWRSRDSISGRRGIPTTRAPLSLVRAKVTPTKGVKRLPSLFAIPGLAFASWITSGVPDLRAAR